MSIENTGAAKLSSEDNATFFRINNGLLTYVGKVKKKIMVLESETDMHGFRSYLADMREICWKKPKEYIRKYLLENTELDMRERTILEEWGQKYIADDFFIMDFKPEYAVVMRVDRKTGKCILYAVKGLSDSLAHVVNRQKPLIVQLLLLPLEGKIIYDGMVGYLNNDIFDEENINALQDIYQNTLAESGIVMEL